LGESDKVKFIANIAVIEGDGHHSLTIVIIKKMLEALGNKAEACRRDSPTPY
jgi:hypothetical protein